MDPGTLVFGEPSLKYHPPFVWLLTCDISWTPLGGQFDWGGRLQKSNGGFQRFPQHVWQPCVERNGRRELDCETDKSDRDESRA